MSEPLVLAAVAAALGGIVAAMVTALVAARANRHKVRAEVEKLEVDAVAVITSTNAELLANVKREAEEREARLLSRIAEMEAQIDHLSQLVERLTEQLRSNGIPPQRWEMP